MDNKSIKKPGPRDLVQVTKWEERFSYPTLGQLRWLIFNKDSNGFSKCIVKIGRRILIDVDRYWEWVEDQNA